MSSQPEHEPSVHATLAHIQRLGFSGVFKILLSRGRIIAIEVHATKPMVDRAETLIPVISEIEQRSAE
jgi:hypothetical protein